MGKQPTIVPSNLYFKVAYFFHVNFSCVFGRDIHNYTYARARCVTHGTQKKWHKPTNHGQPTTIAINDKDIYIDIYDAPSAKCC